MKPWLLARLVVIVAALVAGNVTAQVASTPNTMGLYLDDEATICSGSSAGPATVYLCLTNPTYDYICGFFLEIRSEGDHGFYGLELAPGYQGINLHDLPDFFVGYGIPVPTTTSTVLATFTVLSFDAEQPSKFWLHGSGDGPVAGGYPIILEYVGADQGYVEHAANLSVAFGEPCLILNGGGVVDNETMSLGSVKALYR